MRFRDVEMLSSPMGKLTFSMSQNGVQKRLEDKPPRSISWVTWPKKHQFGVGIRDVPDGLQQLRGVERTHGLNHHHPLPRHDEHGHKGAVIVRPAVNIFRHLICRTGHIGRYQACYQNWYDK